MATGKAAITEGSGLNVSTHTISEDAVTKHIQRVNVNDSAGADILGTTADAASASTSVKAALRAIATALGVTALDLGSGTGGTRTLRSFIDPASQNANGQTTMANSTPTVLPSDFVGTSGFMKKEDVASADGDAGVGMMVVRKATPANSSGTDGDWEPPQISGGYLWVHDNKGLSNRVFSTTFATLTRPANTTAYTAADSISDNATGGSVTALVSGNISDTNDDPIFINELVINSTDTGLAGKKIRAYLFNSDPTASSGVTGGDNAAYAQKKAGYIGSFMGWMETGFSDGTVGRLVPCFNETNFTQAGGFIAVPPVSGARTLYIQYQAVEAFTPSANSTTIIGTARGWQGRAV